MKFIGDVVLTTPIIRSVRAAFPEAFIAYLGEQHAVSLLEHNPFLDEIIAFDFSTSALAEQPRVILELRRRRFDLALDLFGNPRSALIMFLSGASTRVGPDRKGRGRLYTVKVRDDGVPKSAIAFHEQFLRAAGIEPRPSKPEVYLTVQERQEAEQMLTKALGTEGKDRPNIPVVGLHPGATWPAKRWLPERFAGLAETVADRFGVRVVLTRGPNDGEVADAVVRAAGSRICLLPVLPLRQLAAVISLFNVFVSNDAAPMHIAAAVGTPTIGLFGPGEENIWFPYAAEDHHRALRRNVACHPCHLDACNRKGDGYMECMKLLTVNDVFSVIESILGRS